jgi:acetyl/propionyl-CoA carboxylase alpha subunit
MNNVKKTVLILNRGEIAYRAISEAKSLGLNTLCIVNDKEKNGAVAKIADEVILFGDETSGYTDLVYIEKLVLTNDIDFIYPGYGFLSEAPELAGLCEKTGITFIGPNSDCLKKLSSKKESAIYAKKMGLNVLEYDKPTEFEYPLMLKASMGGGGRGNSIVNSKEELEDKVSSLKSKSQELFKNDEIMFERYLPRARHVELQVIASESKVHFFGSRDCSLQMRFQKIMEEGPSCNKSSEILKSYYPAIEEVLLEIGYQGAATIEFLYDEKSEKLFFLEVNTRIQVEHTVSEMIFKDSNLVRMQFEIAMGQIPESPQAQYGHSFCVRIYALDAYDNFIPTLGTVHHLELPEGCRFDSYLEVGTNIMAGYDPMIGKLMVSGESRSDTIEKLKLVLEGFYLHGVKTTIPFIVQILNDSDFVKNKHDISWVEETFQSKFSEIGVSVPSISDINRIRSKYLQEMAPSENKNFAYKEFYRKRYLR